MDDDLRLWPHYAAVTGDMLFRPAFPQGPMPQYVSLQQIADFTGAGTGGQGFRPADYGADITGATPATEAVRAAQAAALAAGSFVTIDGQRLLIDGDINIVAGCPIVGSHVPRPRTTVDYNTATSALVHGPGANINIGQGAALKNVLVLSSTLPATQPTTVQEGVAMVAGMATAGTGITITGSGITLQDDQVLGFATGIVSSHKFQLNLDRVFLDNRSGVDIRSAHDMVVLRAVENWPYLSASTDWSLLTVAITGVADNSGGHPRVTADTSQLATGNTVFIQGVVGFTGVNTKCVIQVIDGSHFDCTNIASAPTAIGSVTGGSLYVRLATPNPSVSNGQTVSSANIPGGTAVLWYSPTTGWLKLSQKATGTNANETLTFANSAYVSGGTVRLSNDYREGTAFYCEDNVLLNAISCFAYGYARNFDLNGERNDNFIACASDFSSSLQDPTSVGIYMRGASRSNLWSGGYIHGSGTPLIQDSTDSSPNVYSIPWIYQGPAPTATIELLQGAAHISDSHIFQGHTFRAPVFIADGIGKAKLVNNDFSGARGDWNYTASQRISSGENGFSSQAYTPEIAGATIITGTTGTTVAAGTTTYAAHGQSTNVAVAREPVPGIGVMRNLYVENSIAPGAGETQTVTIQRNGVDSILAATISDTNRTANTYGLGLERAFVRGDTWVAKVVTSGGAATSTIKFGIEFVPNQLISQIVALSDLTADDGISTLTADNGVTVLEPDVGAVVLSEITADDVVSNLTADDSVTMLEAA